MFGNRVFGLNRRDADVEAAQEVIVPVHAAVGRDVELAAVQQGHAGGVRERAQLIALGEHLLVGHPLHDEVRRVIGDRVVPIPPCPGGRDHSRQRDDAVGEVGVRVQVTAQVFRPNEWVAAPALPRSRRRQLGGEHGVNVVLGGVGRE